jgi:AhpD family alkylhydroperoxidase
MLEQHFPSLSHFQKMSHVASSKKLASYAVKHVYQFTSSRPRHSTTRRQAFLLTTRDLIAGRFREDHSSLAKNGCDANVYPHFVGVFDTVAALLTPTMAFLLICAFLILDFVLSWILLLIPDLPLLGKWFPFLGSFWLNFGFVTGLTFVLAVADAKTKELFALGIAIRCDDCIAFHIKAAVEREEISETQGMEICEPVHQ